MESATPVISEIHYQAVHLLLLQFTEQASHVTGGAGVIGVAPLHRLKISIERRDIDNTDAVALVIPLQLDNVTAGTLLFQFYLIPGNGDRTGYGLVTGSGWNDFKGDHRTAGTTNQVHYFI